MRVLSAFFFLLLTINSFAQKNKTENVVLVTLDGFRWQELFSGADSSLMRQQENLKDRKIKEKFWRDEAIDRRKVLLPFFWTTIAAEGQIYGNRMLGSNVNVTNNQWFSYPGYNELLTGKADNERVHSNDKFYNPNKTVLEFLNAQPVLKGKIAAFTSWDVFTFIINDKRSGVFVSAGLTPAAGTTISEKERTMNSLMPVLPNPLGDVRLDAFTFNYGMEYLKRNKPRVMYFSFDETDDFAHQGEYGAYLNSAHNTDQFISELWKYLQSDPQYRNKTTLIITTDHGRGLAPAGWKDHGDKVAQADQIWLAILGPDSKASGEEKTNGQLYQNQVAKTIAALLGFDYKNEYEVGNTIIQALPSKNTKE